MKIEKKNGNAIFPVYERWTIFVFFSRGVSHLFKFILVFSSFLNSNRIQISLSNILYVHYGYQIEDIVLFTKP